MRVCFRDRAALAMVLSALALFAIPAAGQAPTISQDVITATGTLTNDQQSQLTEYTAYWGVILEQAIDDQTVTDDDVSSARNGLIEPLRNPRATPFFKRSYSEFVSRRLGPLMQADSMRVRLNAMIVVARLTDDGAVKLANDGLNDANPAVRYWAATSIGSMATVVGANSQPLLSSREKLELLDSLAAQCKVEESAEVVQQLLLAMTDMDQQDAPMPAALKTALGALDGRIDWHRRWPHEPYSAETAALRRIYLKLLQATSPDRALLREMARVTHRYMALVSGQIVAAEQQAAANGSAVDRARTDDWTDMLKICELALQLAHGQLGAQGQLPDPVSPLINFRDWAKINKIATEDWDKVLEAAPFSFKPEDLRIEN